MSIAENIRQFRSELPGDVELIAVSKTHSPAVVKAAYEAGHRHFGENKVQEMMAKAEALPDDIRWHLIGHLQTNKVKYIVDRVHLIHSVDSMKLLKEINKRAAKAGKVVDVLIQVHIADEESKFGLDPDAVKELLTDERLAGMEHVRIRGLMGMATFTEDESQVRREFRGLRERFEELKASVETSARWQPEILSMGMSGDWKLAVEEGSNMIRVGTAIFGERDYS